MDKKQLEVEEKIVAKDRKAFELTSKEQGTKYMTEPFGMSEEVRHQVKDLFIRWLAFEEHSTFTQAWMDFLESDVFKKIGWTPKTQNDYFCLGYIFSSGVYEYRTKMGCERRGGIGISLADLLK